MAIYRKIQLLFLLYSALTNINKCKCENGLDWDIMYMLNRRYGIGLPDEGFPISITKTSNETYEVPADLLFPETMFANESFFIHVLAQPTKESLEHGFYLMAIRDPDQTLRFGIHVRKITALRLSIFYRPLDAKEKGTEHEVPFELRDHLNLGIHIIPDKINIYMGCIDVQTGVYEEFNQTGLLGNPLFRPGATLFSLNSGLKNRTQYFEGKLSSFRFYSDPDAINKMCEKTENFESSGVDPEILPEFGNVVVTETPNGEMNNKTSRLVEANECKCVDVLLKEGLLRMKGEKGDRGPPGEPGPPGECSSISCPQAQVGPPGTCTIDQCREAVRGGLRGDPGAPGTFDPNDQHVMESIKDMIEDHVEDMKRRNVLRVDSKPCACPNQVSPDPIKANSFGAMVFEKEDDLRRSAHSLPTGTMVYVKQLGVIYIKIIEATNTWRAINLMPETDVLVLPIPKPIPPPKYVPEAFPTIKGKKLYLVARNEHLQGDLKMEGRITGAYSGSIFRCQESAHAVGLGRAFYPLINTDVYNMDYVVPPTFRYGIPLMNLKGEILFTDFMSLISGKEGPKANIYDFNARNIMDDPVAPCIWFGRRPIYLNGDYAYAARDKCRNWQSIEPHEKALAAGLPLQNSTIGPLSMENTRVVACSQLCRILCIQINPTESVQ